MLKEATGQRGTLFLIGGGDEKYQSWSDDIFKKIIQMTENKSIVVFSYEESSIWMCNYFSWLGAKKTKLFVINSRNQANNEFFAQELHQYDALFIEGGHQNIYYQNWQGSMIKQAIIDFYRSGKLIAGTSAGAMILSEVSFFSKNGRVHPDILFHNPFLQAVSLKDDFLPFLPNTILDTHFSERGRLVRLLPLMARCATKNKKAVTGIGIDEETALIIDHKLNGSVIGNGNVTILKPTTQSQVRFEFPKPPEYTNIMMYQLKAGSQFDFKNQNIPVGDFCQQEQDQPHVKPRKHPVPVNSMIFFDSKSLTSNANKSIGETNKHSNNLHQYLCNEDAELTVISSQESHKEALEIGNQLKQKHGNNITILPITTNKSENKIQMPMIKKSNGIILTGKRLEKIVTFFHSTASAAKAFKSKVKAGVKLAFVNEAIQLAGRWIVNIDANAPIEQPPLRVFDGLNIFKSTILIPNLVKNRDLLSQKLQVVFKIIFEKSINLGILMDEQSYVMFTPQKTLQFSGKRPAILIDTPTLNVLPTPESSTNRIAPEYATAMIHFIHDGFEFDMKTYEVRKVD